jgi:hypothetical protein
MNIKAIELRLRRLAFTKGLFFSKSSARNPDDVEYNTYRILTEKKGEIIKRGLTIEEAEKFILNYMPS